MSTPKPAEAGHIVRVDADHRFIRFSPRGLWHIGRKDGADGALCSSWDGVTHCVEVIDIATHDLSPSGDVCHTCLECAASNGGADHVRRPLL
jgi:hypothetical protein